MERTGASKTLGRTFGYLLLVDQPKTLDEISKQLLYSKATASLTIRQGLVTRLVEKVSLPGERKNRYQASAQSWIKISLEKANDLKTWEETIDRGLSFVPPHSRKSRESLLALKNYLSFINWYISDMQAQYERWTRGEIDQCAKKHKKACEYD